MSYNKNNHGGTALNALICIAVVAVVYAIIRPTLKCGCYPDIPQCQSNLKLIGNAIKMYLSDWDNHFPTNRPYIPGHRLGPVSSYVELSEPADKNQTPRKYQHGPNWVEELSPYIEAMYKGNNSVIAYKCPEVDKESWPASSDTAVVSYAFNANLAEASEGIVRSASNLMMLRELDRPTESVLRPINNTTSTSKSRPISPFLSESDTLFGITTSDMHRNGSHILFVDGHVELYSKDYFPPDNKITKDRCWDPMTNQWYNYGPGAKSVPNYYIRAIAITP